MNRIAFLVVMSACSGAMAQPYDLSWYTIDGGGGTSTGGSFSLSGTIGQPDAGVPLTGGAFTLTGGFWAGAITSACACAADFDQSGGTPDVNDIDAFFTAWLAGDPRADADCSGGTPDVNDIDSFFQQWLAGGC